MAVKQGDVARDVRTAGWKIHYNEYGQGHPIVLLHGGGPGATGWSNYSPNIEAIGELLDALGIAEAAFVGNSMGGHTSLRMAIEQPERVSHLITMGAPVLATPSLFGAAGPSEGIKIMYAGYHDASPEAMKRPEHLADVAKVIPKAPIPIWADLDRLGEVAVPALLIHGRDDRVCSFENSLFLAATIPDSRAHLINRCGHWAQLEHADEFNRLVADFVRNH